MDGGADAAGELVFISSPVRRMHTIVVPQPPVGTDWSYQLKRPGIVWCAYAKLVASAVVANRDPQWTFKSSDGVVLSAVPVDADQTAGSTVQWNWFPLASLANKSSHQCIPIPLIHLPLGATVGPISTGLDAGDQWSLISLTIEHTD